MTKDELLTQNEYTVYLTADVFSADKGLQLDTQAALLLDKVTQNNLEMVSKKLRENYDMETKISIFDNTGTHFCALSELSQQDIKGDTFLYFEGKTFLEKRHFSYNDLLRIIYRLRAPDGCKWDRVQTHESIRSCCIEEAYELVEAIDLKSVEKMCEESGDVTLQGIFNAVIGEDNGEYTCYDMMNTLCNKLVTRHTHIFGDVVATTPQEALKAWEEAKAKEKRQKDYAGRFDGIAKNLPSLTRAYKAQKYAAKVQFEWDNIQGVLDKIDEEKLELLAASNDDDKEAESGDLLFAVVNLLRWLKIEPEVALTRSTNKFINRLNYVERELFIKGLTMETATVDEMFQLYEESKKYYKS